jgi:hypothetical protein
MAKAADELEKAVDDMARSDPPYQRQIAAATRRLLEPMANGNGDGYYG